uniref:Macro domain-containing protein n=1 Tax=Guillardia theta TaxID=55529 RepID=A0A7S4KJ18_GUITH|mmetsp:Transcript_257/g.567  ORF Transcript_257/g.567 Transcript_257/m.567 type:complete len:515 (+) Transcript_257:88-1632(+)
MDSLQSFDPLQAFAFSSKPQISRVELDSLTSWSSAAPNHDKSTRKEVKFAIDEELNRRVFLWEGKLWELAADGIVNSTNESMSDRTGVSGSILSHGGSQLEEEIYQTEGCRTGECRMTRGHALPCKKIIHTVGPRYNDRYVTAAESALHYCYRNALELAVETNLSSLAFCCVYTERKGYPRRDAAHIAIRTVRRFLEQFSSSKEKSADRGLSHVVFCVDNRKDYDIYNDLLRIYFPRNADDIQYQIEKIPEDIGNEKGEPVVDERKVRISAMPGQEEERAVITAGETVTEQFASTESFQSFASMTSAPDASRLSTTSGGGGGGWGSSDFQTNEQLYEQYLRKSLSVDVRHVSRHDFLYRSGQDNNGRPVFVLVGNRFPARDLEDDHVILHLIKTMDNQVHVPYSIVYVHSNFSVALNQPLPSLFSRIHEVLDRRFKKNIKRLYVVHPSMSSRTILVGLRALFSPKFWQKVVYCEKVAHLYEHCKRNEVILPDDVMDYEKEQENSLMNQFFSWSL